MSRRAQALGRTEFMTKPRRSERHVAYTVPKLKDFAPATLDKAVASLLAALEKESTAVRNDDDRKAFRDRWLARKDGVLTKVNDLWLKAAPKESKREGGQRLNQLKAALDHKVESTQDVKTLQTSAPVIDISLPG